MNKKGDVHIISQQDGILPNIYIPRAIWSTLIPCVPPKRIIYGIVLVKNVKIVFTVTQINFSFPDQTAVTEGGLGYSMKILNTDTWHKAYCWKIH